MSSGSGAHDSWSKRNGLGKQSYKPIYVVLLTLLVPRAPNGRFGRPLKPSFLLFPSSSNTLKKTENIYLNRNCNQCNTLVVYYSLTILTSSKKIKTQCCSVTQTRRHLIKVIFLCNSMYSLFWQIFQLYFFQLNFLLFYYLIQSELQRIIFLMLLHQFSFGFPWF